MFQLILILIYSSHATFACKYLHSIPILETSALQKFSAPAYIPSIAEIPQEISFNLTKLFQEKLSIATREARQVPVFFTDATESHPFVIKHAKDGSRILTNELPIDREEICDPFKYPHHASVARKCCASTESKERYGTSPFDPQLNFKCCVFLGITVEGYGTFALRVEVIDINDSHPRFTTPPESTQRHAGKDDLVVVKIAENTHEGTIIPLPRAVDLDEGRNAELLFRVKKPNPMTSWEQHFKLLSGPEDRCATRASDEPEQKEFSPPALCLLKPIDRETVSGFTFDLIARDQGEPVALSTTLSVSIMVLDENDNTPTFRQSEFKVFVKENEVGKTLVHLHVTDLDAGENSRLSYFLRPGTHFVGNQKPSSDFLRMHILASPALDGVVLRLIQPLDYESVKSFDFEVVVQDYGTPRLASTSTVSVEVLNTNDQPPVIRFFNKGNLLNSDYASLEREEDTDNQLPKVICHVHVYDQDTSLDEVFCDISSHQRLFDLREVSSENTVQQRKVYELISLAQLDREKAPSYSVGVRCVDGRTTTRLIGQSQIRILLKDANDNPPVFEKSQFFGTVVENEADALVDFKDSFSNYGNPTAKFVGPSHIRATDADTGPNAAISYSLAAWTRDADNSTQSDKADYQSFYIDPVTGQLKTRVPLDFEKKSSYHLLLIATDQPIDASQALSSTAKLTITVKDVDDNPPTMLQQHYAFEVTEGVPSHTVVGRVEATDIDSLPENRIINYHLKATTDPVTKSDASASYAAAAALHYFTIDRHSGVIRTVRPLDREQTPNVTLEVVAHSSSSGISQTASPSSPSSTATVVINVLDKNDNAPYMVSLLSPDRTRVLLAEVVIPPDRLQGESPICVPFAYAFYDDDDQSCGNGNVSVTLDNNPNFVFNEDHSQLCIKDSKTKSTTLPLPGRYSLNVLAHDNPKEAIHRLTKRFPLRVLVQSPAQESQGQVGVAKNRESSQRRQVNSIGVDPAGRRSTKPSGADRILSGRQQHPPTALNRGVANNGEYKNVTIISVLLCMACILCIILLAILLFVKKCTPIRNFANKGHHQTPQTGGLGPTAPMTLHDLSPKGGQFGTVGRYPEFDPEQYPCVDIQPQMLVTLPPGSEKSFATISPTGQVVGSMIYTDDANRVSPLTPLITQKNNLMPSACHAGSLQKVSLSPIYGTSSVGGGVAVTAVTNKPPIHPIPLVTQYHPPPPPPRITPTIQSKGQTYSTLLPSKSYDELHRSSSKTRTREHQQDPLLGTYKASNRPTPIIFRRHQDGYQTSPKQLTSSNNHDSVSLAPVTSMTLDHGSAIAFAPEHLTSSPSGSPSDTPNQCVCGQASFV
ncbi:unnamed protein product [Mesocestoides corti]|nr:unnamed protein product [Mesocestoides corti]